MFEFLTEQVNYLIDRFFLYSLTGAHRYSSKGPPCYDPPNKFLLDLFRHIDAYKEMSLVIFQGAKST